MKITLQNLTKKFPARGKKERGEVVAVNDFNFEIPDGELVGLLGPSGCGKSTTLNLICGLLKPTAGKIFFGEDDVTGLPPENRGVGLVFQSYALYPHLTVEQNIRFPLENLKGPDKLSKEKMREKVYEAAKLVQIEGLMERRPGELSGGQQLQTREEIRRIQKETGITTVFVTHDQDEAMSISDRIVVMKDGVVQQIGKPQEVYDNPVNLFVAKFLGTPPINVFEGSVKNGRLIIGGDAVLDTPQVPDCRVTAAVRPEGFLLQEDGPLQCNLSRLEVMGRDVSVVSAHPCCENAAIRSIISAENQVDLSSPTVRFALKPAKTFLFHQETGERIR